MGKLRLGGFGWLLALVMFGAVGCGASVKYITFEVPEGNRNVTVKKFYNDGFDAKNSSDPTERAYRAVVAGDIVEAIRLAKEAIQAKPNDEWNHYNLGILYEAHHEWQPARDEMIAAQKINPKTTDYQKEIAFIDAHK